MQQMVHEKITYRKNKINQPDAQIRSRLPGKKITAANTLHQNLPVISAIRKTYPSGFHVMGTVKLNGNKAHIATPNSDNQSGPEY